MDHNNSNEEKCSCGADKKNCTFCQDCNGKINVPEKTKKKYCMCPHEMCKDHDPEWKNMAQAFLSPNPGIFGAKTYWFKRCCKKGMTRYEKVQMQLCAKCGRTQIKVLTEVAICECCGYHYEIEKVSEMKDGRNTRPTVNRPNISPGSIQPKRPHNKP